MKKFAFKLQKLLNLRAFREKEAETVLVRAIAVRDGIVLRIQEITALQLKTRKVVMGNKLCGLSDLTALEHYFLRLYTEKEEKLAALTEAEIKIEQARCNYRIAHKERLIITKLCERKELAWKASMLKEQDSIIDDMVSAAAHRNYASV